jgi:hypothetical protein
MQLRDARLEASRREERSTTSLPAVPRYPKRAINQNNISKSIVSWSFRKHKYSGNSLDDKSRAKHALA